MVPETWVQETLPCTGSFTLLVILSRRAVLWNTSLNTAVIWLAWAREEYTSAPLTRMTSVAVEVYCGR